MPLYRQKLRLLFLYSELADYFIACLKKLVEIYEVEAHVIHWPINKEAPFHFNFPNHVKFYEKTEFKTSADIGKKIEIISPDFIYCSGWMDKDYLKALAKHKTKIPVVIGLDTKWEGKLRQHIASALSRATIRNLFSHCWVPGQQQKKYALKLGFKENEIITGYYSADTDYFGKLGQNAISEKNRAYPHRFIYMGRYYDFKGITDVWSAFSLWQMESESDWELWCLGTGDIQPVRHSKIKHFGFVQPKNIEPYIAQTGVFIMPSRVEPWGVALHEFASAGFPLLCSDKVGAAEAFLRDGENGYIYPAENINKLKEVMAKITALSDDTLRQMGDVSRQLAMKITPALWADTLMNNIYEHKKKQHERIN